MANIFEEFPALLELSFEGIQSIDDVYLAYSFDTCATVTHPTSAMYTQDVSAALILTQGVLLDAAKILKRSRSSLEAFISKDHRLMDLRNELAASLMDRVESLHNRSALNGDATAQRFLLSTLGKNRGYSTRTEATGKDGKDLAPPVLSADIIGKLSDSALAEVLAARDQVEDETVT